MTQTTACLHSLFFFFSFFISIDILRASMSAPVSHLSCIYSARFCRKEIQEKKLHHTLTQNPLLYHSQSVKIQGGNHVCLKVHAFAYQVISWVIHSPVWMGTFVPAESWEDAEIGITGWSNKEISFRCLSLPSPLSLHSYCLPDKLLV